MAPGVEEPRQLVAIAVTLGASIFELICQALAILLHIIYCIRMIQDSSQDQFVEEDICVFNMRLVCDIQAI